MATDNHTSQSFGPGTCIIDTDPTPVTPRRSLVPAANILTPTSPSPRANVKRKQLDSPESKLKAWNPFPPTPPYIDKADEVDLPPFKRGRLSWGRSDTEAVFAQIEADIDVDVPTDSQLKTQLPSDLDAIDLDTYVDEAIQPILASPFDGDSGFDASLYNGVDNGESASDQICFGMIKVDQFELAADICLPPSPRTIFPMDNLQMTQTGSVLYTKDNSLTHLGTVGAPMPEILSRLGQLQSVFVQFHCIVKQISTAGEKRKGHRMSFRLEANLYANVYGPFCAFESIGDFLEDCDICLQDPEGCDRNVQYRNPHRISGRDRDAPMTVDREVGLRKPKVEPTTINRDYFDSLAMHSELEMVEGSTAVKTKLHSYQQQALLFMLMREQGWSFNGPLDDIWAQTDIGGIRMYVNTITDETQLAAPPDFRGGLLADQMGLGKTLSIISLIASDFYPSSAAMSIKSGIHTTLSSHYSKCTLVIVPPNLLDEWESQLQEHCQVNTIQWSRHHDKSRFSTLSQMKQYHIILTTYNTVSAEWRTHKNSSILYSTDWHRIVLDEAHYIKGERNQLARAICDLKAYRRWAVTGTPIQNHLNDLEALLKFLRLHPYNEHVQFERDIISLWRNDSEAAIARLKRLIACITLRRTTSAIQLPSKRELLFTLPFSIKEQELYGPLEAKFINTMNQPSFHGSSTAAGRAHALKGLHVLRSICNLGILADTRSFLSSQDSGVDWGPSDAQWTFEALAMSGVALCTECSNQVTVSSASIDTTYIDTSFQIAANPIVSQCEQIICGPCVSSLQHGGELLTDWCGHIPPCATFSITTSQASVASLCTGSRAIDPADLPTKIKALIENIRLHSTSKSVVFSCWRTTLDLAAIGLESANIKFTRFDGEVSHSGRVLALANFRNDASVQVLLITTTCGAVGLNLTAADRAYIMEPQWNPTIEDQALSRIYRLGQVRPVTIIRLVMDASIEQRVMEVKSSKRNFAELLFASKRKGLHPGDSRGNFELWRTLLR